MSSINTSKIIKKREENEPESKKLDNRTKFSFTITYILLITVISITFIEALRTKKPFERHILNLETCIALISAYFYSIFVDKIVTSEEQMKPANWEEISQNRYLDRAITSPLLLLTLCIFFTSKDNKPIKLANILILILLTYIVLYIGYIGEIGTMNKYVSLVMGLLGASVLFYFMYVKYIIPYNNRSNKLLFTSFMAISSLYGIAYLFDDEYKNMANNYLDMFSKVFIGIGFWMKFSNMIEL